MTEKAMSCKVCGGTVIKENLIYRCLKEGKNIPYSQVNLSMNALATDGKPNKVEEDEGNDI